MVVTQRRAIVELLTSLFTDSELRRFIAMGWPALERDLPGAGAALHDLADAVAGALIRRGWAGEELRERLLQERAGRAMDIHRALGPSVRAPKHQRPAADAPASSALAPARPPAPLPYPPSPLPLTPTTVRWSAPPPETVVELPAVPTRVRHEAPPRRPGAPEPGEEPTDEEAPAVAAGAPGGDGDSRPDIRVQEPAEEGASPDAVALRRMLEAFHAARSDASALSALETACSTAAAAGLEALALLLQAEALERHGRPEQAADVLALVPEQTPGALLFDMALRRAAWQADQGRLESADASLQHAASVLAQARSQEEQETRALLLEQAIARTALVAGQPEAARDRLDTTRLRWRAQGDRSGQAVAAAGQAVACWSLGEHEAAERWGIRAEVLSRSPQTQHGTGWATALRTALDEGPLGAEDEPRPALRTATVRAWLREQDLSAPGIARLWHALPAAASGAARRRLSESLRALGVPEQECDEVVALLVGVES